ncbi:MAG: hypothetical protein A2041_00855 [Bacteroidetes bacterium GWA2_31_9b]|nr:MAG: hypothetical protein A2041_00855 [Bacteroidetes bacterium GWA2_31_9b]
MYRSNIKYIIYRIIGLFILIISLSFNYVDIDHNPNEPVSIEQNNPPFFRNKNITDGPYIFYENNNIIVKWIKRNRVVTRIISDDNIRLFKNKFGIEINSKNLKNPVTDSINFNQKYNGVENIVAISDVHGQYELFIQLLRNNKVIDANLKWNFGNGHLVILGDIFDRGPKVTELLWLIYQLENQAKEAGGKLHYILGNHELMILNNDLRYINEKYTSSANKMNMVYSQLYAENTFLGKWIRTKPVLVTINDILFVHAGISPEIITKGLTSEEINNFFINHITGKSWDVILNDSLSAFLMEENGPIWYRGFFESKVTKNQLVNILNYFNVNHIVVGHTTFPNIISIDNGKIIAIDSNIKEGDFGEVLIYNSGIFYRGTSSGGRIEFVQE